MAHRKVTKNTESVRALSALLFNLSAAKGLQGILKSNLGPKGTMKLLVSGAQDLRMTKDGSVLLHEMQITHPGAMLLARAATAQDEITGDGTTSNVLLIAELLKQAEKYLAERLHPRILTDGFDLAKTKALAVLEDIKVEKDTLDRDLLLDVARTSLRTKVRFQLADVLCSYVVDGVLTIRKENRPIDLYMVEIMTMKHRQDIDTTFVKGLVLDHGCRHPDMPKKLDNCFILTCNVSLEYEKPEVNASFKYSSTAQRQKMADAERKFIDDRVRAIIALKKEVCDTEDKHFVIINQKGIDPYSLDMLAKEGIMALRRAKRRNMERLTLACGGVAVNSVESLSKDVLGYAEHVWEHVLGEEKYTFVDGVKNPLSCTILIKGPNDHEINQTKDAIRDGLRAVKNAIEDKAVVPGGGAFEIAAHEELKKYADTVEGKTRLGVLTFAEALLIIPKTLAENSGLDSLDAIIGLQEEYRNGTLCGLDLATGEPFDPQSDGIWDNVRVKRQMLHSASIVATQMLLVDEILRAGKPQ